MGKLRAKFTDYPQLPLTPSIRSNKKSSDRTGNFLRYINFSIDKLYIFIFPLDSQNVFLLLFTHLPQYRDWNIYSLSKSSFIHSLGVQG